MDEVGRQRVDSYFLQRDRELIEKLRKDAQRQAERERLAEAAGVAADHDVLKDLESLGYTSETVELLHLVPLVGVAWADGNVDADERALVLEAAAAHGVKEGSPARTTLESWLSERPSAEFLGRTLELIKVLIGVRPEEEQRASRSSLLALCSEVAAVSGGILGIGKVSGAERKVLEKVATALEHNHEAAAKRVVDEA